MRSARLLFFGLILLISACSTTASATTTTASLEVAVKPPVVALPGYEVSVFTQNDSRILVSGPDSIAVDGQHVFIDYQNVTAKDCTDQGKTGSPTSTVIEYDLRGKILNHWPVAGHSDGMRVDPSTHLVWTTSCEDGNPMFATIDPAAGTVTPYKFPDPPHGGGYDDLYFLAGSVSVPAPNPTPHHPPPTPNPPAPNPAPSRTRP